MQSTSAALNVDTASAASPPILASGVGRIAWLDYARGIAMVLVVYGHCFRGLTNSGIASGSSVLGTVDYLIYTFHMPVFFLISGILAARSPVRGGASFWLSKVEPIVWPYLLWMSVEIVVLTMFSGVTNEGKVPFGLSTYLFHPASPFWFLYALFVSYVFLAYACRLGPVAMLGIAAVIFAAGRFATPASLAAEASWGLLYFITGAMLSSYVRKPKFITVAARGPIVLLCAAVALGMGVAFRDIGWSNELAIPSALLGCVAVFGVAEWLARLSLTWHPIRLVMFIGQASLTVLVTHLFGTAGTRIVLSHFFHVDSVPVHLVSGTVVGIGGALVLQIVGARLGILRLLGLPRLARPG